MKDRDMGNMMVVSVVKIWDFDGGFRKVLGGQAYMGHMRVGRMVVDGWN